MSQSHALYALARIVMAQGDPRRATALCEEALGLFRERDDDWGRENVLRVLMIVSRLQNDDHRVATLAREAVILSHDLGSRRGAVASFESLAWVARIQGRAERAGRLHAAADAIRDTVGTRRPEPERGPHEAEVAALRTALGEETFAAVWAEGRAMTLEQAIAYALENAGREEPAEPHPTI